MKSNFIWCDSCHSVKPHEGKHHYSGHDCVLLQRGCTEDFARSNWYTLWNCDRCKTETLFRTMRPGFTDLCRGCADALDGQVLQAYMRGDLIGKFDPR